MFAYHPSYIVLCLCPLNLSFKLDFNISKKAYSILNRQNTHSTRSQKARKDIDNENINFN